MPWSSICRLKLEPDRNSWLWASIHRLELVNEVIRWMADILFPNAKWKFWSDESHEIPSQCSSCHNRVFPRTNIRKQRREEVPSGDNVISFWSICFLDMPFLSGAERMIYMLSWDSWSVVVQRCSHVGRTIARHKCLSSTSQFFESFGHFPVKVPS
jgi:hypothetical protein